MTSDASGTRPPDLAEGEQDVASWLGSLEAPAPPPTLLGRVTAALPNGRAALVPRGRATVAAAGLLAVVLAAAVGFSLLVRDAGDGEVRSLPPAVPAEVVDDPCVPLYRGLETFRALDLEQAGTEVR